MVVFFFFEVKILVAVVITGLNPFLQPCRTEVYQGRHASTTDDGLDVIIIRGGSSIFRDYCVLGLNLVRSSGLYTFGTSRDEG